MAMDDLLKKFLYTGVGLVATTAEKLKDTVEEVLDSGEEIKEEGEKILEDFVDDIEVQKSKLETSLRQATDKVLEKFQFPTIKEVEGLRARIKDLEDKLKE